MRIARSFGQSVPTLILFLTTKFGMLLKLLSNCREKPLINSTP
jgi:hypothetical protein